MANSKSAKKRIKQNIKSRGRNRSVRARVRTLTRNFEKAIEAGKIEEAREQLPDVVSALDRAASKGIIPSSRASRKKSRLASRLEKAAN